MAEQEGVGCSLSRFSQTRAASPGLGALQAPRRNAGTSQGFFLQTSSQRVQGHSKPPCPPFWEQLTPRHAQTSAFLSAPPTHRCPWSLPASPAKAWEAVESSPWRWPSPGPPPHPAACACRACCRVTPYSLLPNLGSQSTRMGAWRGSHVTPRVYTRISVCQTLMGQHLTSPGEKITYGGSRALWPAASWARMSE